MSPAPVLCLSPVGSPHDAGHPRELVNAAAADRRVYWLENSARPCRLAMLSAMRSGPLTLLTPYLPRDTAAVDEPRLLAPLLESALDADGAEAPIVWCFDAKALPLVTSLRTGPIVYDCARTPRNAASRAAESAALSRAQVVVTSDASQFARLRPQHRQVYLAPAGGPSGGSDTALLAIVDGVQQALNGGPRSESPGAVHGYRVIRGGVDPRQPALP